jgi:hypothetical protein
MSTATGAEMLPPAPQAAAGAGVRAGPCRGFALSCSRSGRVLRSVRLAYIPNKGLPERGGFSVSYALKLSGFVRGLLVFLFVGYECSRKILGDRARRAGFPGPRGPPSSVENYGRQWVEDRTLRDRYRRREPLLRWGLVPDEPVYRAAREKPNRRTPRLRRGRSPRAGRRERAVQAPSGDRRGR